MMEIMKKLLFLQKNKLKIISFKIFNKLYKKNHPIL